MDCATRANAALLQSPIVAQLLPRKNQTLLLSINTLNVAYLRLDSRYAVAGRHIQRDNAAIQQVDGQFHERTICYERCSWRLRFVWGAAGSGGGGGGGGMLLYIAT